MTTRAARPSAVPARPAVGLTRTRHLGAVLLAIGVIAVATASAANDELLQTIMGSFVAVGAVICWKRQHEPVGWLLVVAGLLFGVSNVTFWSAEVVNTSARPPPLAVFGAWVFEWAWIPMLALLFVVVPMLLPDGRPASTAFGRLLRLIVVVIAAWTVTAMFTAQLADDPQRRWPGIANPAGLLPLDDVENPPTLPYLQATLVASMAIAAASIVTRYRRSIGRQRVQLRWIAYGAVVTIVGFVVVVLAPVAQSTTDWLLAFVVPLLPLSIGVAVLRHNLYDIDRLVSRTVAYGAVTALLVAVYLVLVFVLRAGVPVHGDLPVAVSTLAVAALFNSLRQRVQRVVDRRFNRARYDAARTIDAFAERLRSQVNLSALAHDLEVAVAETVQPTAVSLWLQTRTATATTTTEGLRGRRPAATRGDG